MRWRLAVIRPCVRTPRASEVAQSLDGTPSNGVSALPRACDSTEPRSEVQDHHQARNSGDAQNALRRSENGSNLYGAFPVKSCFWLLGGSLFGAGKPFFIPSPAIRFAERAEGVKGPKP